MNRLLEVILSILSLVILFPFFIIIIALIILDDPGSPFFIQCRVGKNFKLFNLIKFRTMRNVILERNPVVTAENDLRITKIGRVLRKTKLDELPQILNILKGDMSFVGPRPELLYFINFYKEEYKDILSINPGITDFATIKFKNEENLLTQYTNHEETYIKEILPEKIKLYKKYLREKCLLTDLRLIFLTLFELLPSNTHNYLYKFYHYLNLN